MTPIVFLPGLLNDAALWSHQVAGLADIAAPQVADLTRHDTVADMAAATLAQAPDRFALAGLSMGGYVAFEMLRQQPERITRLALIDTRASLDSPAETQRRQGFVRLARTGKFKGVTPRLLPALLDEANLNDETLTQTVTGMAQRVGREAFIRQQTAIMHRPDSRPLLPAIDKPTLVVCGRNDALTPVVEHEFMAERIPDADLVVLARAGHLAPLERPAAVTNALRGWLTG
ncbi:Pimeloyl-ACP methyl ester carboxylesterase [Limimonas halophila]|uniref:Pimeloyl-ACP methyl ester carboxylesterase n=1 Tax=Limimonas halophila TaxID=1082479 RepID=A0A1G7N5H0_9PROT|nr:alpha/beta hydrolase [Limimonas halophila]SDF69137.1 Pimeloyl-ACP methyl ester carboxylesterase [Limimonas halophila]